MISKMYTRQAKVCGSMLSRPLCASVAKSNPGHTVCVIGAHGRGKSTMLQALYLNEIDRHWRGQQPALPVMLRFSDCVHPPSTLSALSLRRSAKFFEVQGGRPNRSVLSFELFRPATIPVFAERR